ncbi:hypothetical protein V2G26_012015 [Clonostachys chloroleuca]
MASFIFVNPSSCNDLAQACQTCFRTFGSNTALRRHIAKYQFREQRLLARLLEIQAHLPQKNSLSTAEIVEYRKNDAFQTCQTCFITFDSTDTLRSHVVQYQLEQQRLVARLSDIQAHTTRKIPRLSSKELASISSVNRVESISCDDHFDNSEDDVEYGGDCSDADDNADKREHTRDTNEGNTRSTADETSNICPHVMCVKDFSTRVQLSKHFQSHVQCLQICIYCRDIHVKISAACRHDCDDRREANREARNDPKETYRTDRCEQLSRESKRILKRMLLRVSASQRRKRKLGSAYRDEESGAPKKLKGHDIGLNSISGIRAGQDTTDSVEAQLFQSGVPQMDWSGMSTKASQMLDGYAPIFGDNTIPPVCPDPPQSNIASTGALFEYAPIFEDSTIPPVYSVTSFANMTAIGALSEYAPIFEDGTIPPVYSTSLRSTDAFCEYAPIFEDGTIPPLYSSRSHLDTAFSKVPCEDDVARFV